MDIKSSFLPLGSNRPIFDYKHTITKHVILNKLLNLSELRFIICEMGKLLLSSWGHLC